MYIDISTKEQVENVLELFKSFSCRLDIFRYYDVPANFENRKYLNEIADKIGFDFTYYQDKKKSQLSCLYCGKPLSGTQTKFCSRSCAASFNNQMREMSEETKIKISNSLRNNFEKKESNNQKSHYKGYDYHLGKKIFKYGLKEYRCEICGITEWMGKPLILQVHHKDGNHFNDDINNLQVLCPNCHSQTDNYCSKNRKKEPKTYTCKNCGKKLKNIGKTCLCNKCYNEQLSGNSARPDKETLTKDYQELKTFAALSKQYKVSPRTIKKWLLLYNLISK